MHVADSGHCLNSTSSITPVTLWPLGHAPDGPFRSHAGIIRPVNTESLPCTHAYPALGRQKGQFVAL